MTTSCARHMNDASNSFVAEAVLDSAPLLDKWV